MSFKDRFNTVLGSIVIFGFIIWVFVQCTGGDERSDGLNTRTLVDTYLAADVETFKRGQEVIATGDATLFGRFMNQGNVIHINEGTNVYIHDISPLKGYARVTIRSGAYHGEVGYVPSIALDKSPRSSVESGVQPIQPQEETPKKANPPLIQAIIDKDIAKVKELSTNPDRINEQDDNGYTPLHTAILFSEGDMTFIELLVEHGADLTIKNDRGVSPFFMAVDFSFVKAIHLFLDKGGVDVNELDPDGNTPLMKLALRGGIPTDVFMQLTDQLVEAGADLTIENKEGDTFYSNLKQVQYDSTIQEIEQKYPFIFE